LQENLIHFYPKPNEILTKEKTYFLFQEFLGFNVAGEIFDVATRYQMKFPVVSQIKHPTRCNSKS